MDDKPTNENPEKGFNKLDLSQLQSFSFGTQWTQDKADPAGRSTSREPRREDRGRREGPGGGADPRRDRRGFRRPAGAPAGEGAGTATHAPGGAPYREGPGGRGPRREPRGDYRGPRQGGGYHEGDQGAMERGPYISPYLNVTFYPEDTSFAALAKTIRASCRTFELFDIARTVIGKIDRFVVVVQHKSPEGGDDAASRSKTFSISVPDGLPFENDDAAIAHVVSTHLSHFFDTTEAEVEAPKGNYQVINRCGVTGTLLGPPNYHRYNQIVQQHHASQVARMPFEAFRARIETVRDPEVVNQWLEQMKKVTRYVWKLTPEGGTPLTFDHLEDARLYLVTHARDQVIKQVESARFPGKQLDLLPQGEIYRAIEGALERQRRFPLDTANALRGRLRREGFTIFKKGSKGVSYVCAVKRKFRVPGQVFADSIGTLISFIEANPMVKASELSERLLGIKAPAAAAPKPPAPEPAEGSTEQPPAVEVAAPTLTAEEQQKLARLQGDLRWLVMEGYVTEFMDGRLFTPPPMAESRKKEAEASEHDPENFPDAPAAAEQPKAEPLRSRPAAKPSESAAPVSDQPDAPEAEVPATEPSASASSAAPEVEQPVPTSDEPGADIGAEPEERKPEPPAE